MQVNNELIDKIAGLAKLEFSEVEKKDMVKDLDRILEFVEQLNTLDTEGVEPLVHMSEETNIMREDVIKMEITHEEALKNAPKKNSDYFLVPKVLGKNIEE
jgi:aspartyl-tRNA(Asn)/glutamyl-tRNA(Gln) amidotransferase subunit C